MSEPLVIILNFLSSHGLILLALGAVIGILNGLEKLSRRERFLRWRTKLLPNSAEAHLDLGRALADREPQAAEIEINRAIALNPKLRNSYYALAQLQVGQDGSLADAEQTIKRMLSLFPGDAIAFAYKGIYLEATGSYSEAELAYRRAIEAAPGSGSVQAWLYALLAHVLHPHLHNDEEAEIAYQAALRNDRHDTASMFNLARLYTEAGRESEAIRLLRVATRQDPRSATYRIHLALSLFDTGQRTEAERLLPRIMAARSKSAHDEFNLGLLLLRFERLPEAEAAYRQAIAKDPDFIPAYNDLALLLESRLSRIAEAEQLFRQALKVSPNNEHLSRNLALLLRKSHREREAIALLRGALSADPENGDCYLALASTELLVGDHAAFLRDIGRARTLIPAEDFYSLACIESLCQNRDAAFEYLRKAAQRPGFELEWAREDPDFEYIREDPVFEEILRSAEAGL